SWAATPAPPTSSRWCGAPASTRCSTTAVPCPRARSPWAATRRRSSTTSPACRCGPTRCSTRSPAAVPAWATRCCGNRSGWRATATVRSHEAGARLAELGCEVRTRSEPAFLLYEWYCPGCASLLEVNLYPEETDPIHDLRVGERLAEPIGQAL